MLGSTTEYLSSRPNVLFSVRTRKSGFVRGNCQLHAGRVDGLPSQRSTSIMKLIEEIITPAKAKIYLEGNSTNRPLSRRHVNYLADEINGGRWQCNAETIKFNGSKLLDGQHRLHAVVKSGQPIRSIVARGLDEAAFHTIDMGKKRSAADTLNVLGEKSSTRIASALAMIEAMLDGQTRTSGAVSGTRVIELLKTHPDVRDSVRAYQGPKTLLKPSVAIALHYFFAKRDRTLADQFFDDLRSGAGLGASDPVFTLREKLISNSVGTKRLRDDAIIACTIKAWNALRSGATIKRLTYRPGSEPVPVIS